MITAVIAVFGSWRLYAYMASGWGALLPSVLLLLLGLRNFNVEQLRILIVIFMLTTLGMLLNPRLRHFLLLPSCLALTCGLMAVALNTDIA